MDLQLCPTDTQYKIVKPGNLPRQFNASYHDAVLSKRYTLLHAACLASVVTGWCVFCEVPCPGKEPDFRRSLPNKRKPYVGTTSVYLSVTGVSV